MNIELLEKYAAGSCTPEEQQQVKAWLENDPGIMEAWLQQAASEPVTSPMPAAMEASLLAAFREHLQPVQKKPVRTMRRAIRIWAPAVAAALLAGIFILRQWSPLFQSHDYVTIASSAAVQKIILPDQSVVWLKPGASLRYDRGTFGKKERAIALLQGESFFEVVHNAAQPFVVESGHVQTTDIGTAFSVRNDAQHDAVVVTLASGEVAVSHDHHMLSHMVPGQQFSISQQDGAFTKTTQPLWMASVWKENVLQLTNVSFDELSQAMQQFYNVRLQSGLPAVRAQTYTIQLRRSASASAVVMTICMLNQDQYKKQTNGDYLVY